MKQTWSNALINFLIFFLLPFSIEMLNLKISCNTLNFRIFSRKAFISSGSKLTRKESMNEAEESAVTDFLHVSLFFESIFEQFQVNLSYA